MDVFDIIGVGFGPSNIALAIALEERQIDLRYTFFDKAQNSLWQDGMLIDGSDIQNNPIRDLVTPRNPRSRYTFINYLKETGRLFDYLNLGLHYPLRKDYAHYILWAAEQFRDYVHYSTPVTSLEIVSGPDRSAQVWRVTTGANKTYLARCLVLASGRTPNIPQAFRPFVGDEIFHLNDYLPSLQKLDLTEDSNIVVLGSSQSAVEILIDLLNRYPSSQITSIFRSFSFRLKDTSAFSDHVYFPEFIDYFFNASKASKRELERQLRPTNYSSADGDVIHQLYVRLYEERLDGKHRVNILNNTAIDKVEKAGKGWNLCTTEVHTGQKRTVRADAVILATGFLDLGVGETFEPYPPMLAQVRDALCFDADGVIDVRRDYSVPMKGEHPPLLYLNGLCESTHGLGDAGSFSLVSLRSMKIALSAARWLGVETEPEDPTPVSPVLNGVELSA